MDESESPDEEPREADGMSVEGEGAAVEDTGEGAGEAAEGEAPEVSPEADSEDSSGDEPSDPAGEVPVGEEEGEVFADGEDADPAGQDEGGGDSEAEGGEDGDPDASDEDGIVYTMTGEDPVSDPAGEVGEGGEADDGDAGPPSDAGEIILEPGEEADVRGSDGVLLDGRVLYMTMTGGGFGEPEPRTADGPADYDRIEAMLAVRSEWPDLSSGACFA